MPRIMQTEVFKFSELDDRAKERARDWYRNGALDYEWWDCTFDDAKQCLALAGFDVDKIYFSGFSSQGDGACFNGSWHANKAQPVKAMKQHAPKDTELHAIAAEARAIAKLRGDASLHVRRRARMSRARRLQRARHLLFGLFLARRRRRIQWRMARQQGAAGQGDETARVARQEIARDSSRGARYRQDAP